MASKKSPVGLWEGGHDGFFASVVVRRIPKVSNGKEASDVSHSASWKVTTSHEFVVNGWIKALVSAEPFCRLETSTSNSQPNGHDHGKVPEPTARAEVWSEVCLPASLTPPAEEECTGAFRSFGPNCCLVRSVGQDLAAATQGGRKSKGWTQDRFSRLYDGLVGSTVLFWKKTQT